MKKKLTEKGLKSLKPPARGQLDVYDLGGPPGFHVRVSAAGVKSFALLYRRNGRKRKWTIGRFPALSLAEAREKAKTVDVLKEDPQKTRVEARRVSTFADLAAQFFTAQEKRLKPKTVNEWKRIWKAELEPELGTMRPDEITRADIRALLEAKAETAPYMSNRILETVRRMYSWAVETEKVQASPCVGLKRLTVEHQRERVLTHDEIRRVLNALDEAVKKPKDKGSKRHPEFARAFFHLAFVTAARKGELLAAKWADIDQEQKLWTLPDTKMNRAHVIPLCGKAVSVLESLPRDSEWIFRGEAGRLQSHPKRAIAELRVATKIDFRIHDVRRTTATGLAQLGVRTEVISAVLNHVIAGPEATRVYQRHSWIPEMRTALERWAGELERIRSGAAAKVAVLR